MFWKLPCIWRGYLLSLPIIIGLAVVPSDADVNKHICNTCIKINTTCYNLTYLFELDAPFRSKVVIHKMGILRTRNILYYSFEPDISDSEYYKVAFVDLDNTNKSGVIAADKITRFNFGTFDIDQENEIIYLGGSSGIYALNAKDNSLVPYSSFVDTIISLFYKGYIFFVRYGENKIIKKVGDLFYGYVDESKVMNFVIDKDNNVVFQSSYGLFVSKNGATHKLSKNPFFRGITLDLDGKIYVWYLDSLYRVVIADELSETELQKVAEIPSLGSMTFDNRNNILFTSDNSLYRLSPTALTKC